MAQLKEFVNAYHMFSIIVENIYERNFVIEHIYQSYKIIIKKLDDDKIDRFEVLSSANNWQTESISADLVDYQCSRSTQDFRDKQFRMKN
jgi:hypothetical protein